MENKKVIPEISADALRLAQYLRGIGIGEIVAYEKVTEIIGRDARSKGRPTLVSAEKIVQREHQIVFGTVRGVGIKRLSDDEIASLGIDGTRKIHRTARRTIKSLGCADFSKMKNESKIRHNMAMSLLGVFYEITKSNGIKRIESAVAVTQKSLPVSQTLEAFRT